MILSSKDACRFRQKFAKRGPNECWEWHASKDDSGYGLFKLRGYLEKAHRIAYFNAYGQLKDKCLHNCDNPSCVNPNHLFDGTSKENAEDRDEKGRGVLPKPIILTPSDIEEASKLYDSGGTTYQQLADQYGVSIYCMHYNIRRFKHGSVGV